ncbi:MAG: methyl-accepting chemotaxis protein [Nitrospirae bacterium]|nr:methyl-accepting chemotaxis protein [Nitrospirota bacterium]
MIKNSKIKVKIGLGFGIILLLILLMDGGIFSIVQGIKSHAVHIEKESLPYELIADDIVIDIVQIQQFLSDVSATHNKDGFKDAEEYASRFKDDTGKVIALYREKNDSDSIKKMEEIRGIFDNYYDIGKKMANTYVDKGVDEGNKIMVDFDKISSDMQKKVGEFRSDQVNHAKDKTQSIVKMIGNTLTTIVVMFVVILAAGIIITIWIGNTIVRPLQEAIDVSNRMAEGDLTMDIGVSATDETGQLLSAMKNMAEKLKNIMYTIRTSSDDVASASRDLSASSEQMSNGISEQSNRASQIATSSTQMSQTVVDVARNASTIASSATEAATLAKDGETIVGKSIEEVKSIANAVSESAKLIITLGQRSNQIGDIINVIKDIADQTNLLALNAAIEAARAGEQGRGFAVVADEVRKLAERTAKATSEIGGMIVSIQQETQKAVTSMDGATHMVETGVEYASKAGDALSGIVQSINSLQSMVEQIASATEEMSTVSETITSDIETIANVSQETNLSAEQITRSASNLSKISSDLQKVVGHFNVNAGSKEFRRIGR